MLKEFFLSVGFTDVAPLNIADSKGETDLVVAGVQIIDDVIHNNRPARTESLFIAQPCVRMQFQPHIKTNDGFSTSFVNVCTEKMNGNFEEHLLAIDSWLTVLSQLGMHMNDIVIVVDAADNNWGTGKFAMFQMFVVYGMLELGDAGYAVIPTKSNDLIPISDIGFGLERLVWAINKTDTYFDLLAPCATKASREKLDVCRTLALLAICGVRPLNKGPGLQFRRLAKILSDNYYSTSLFSILEYYLEYWSHFFESPIVLTASTRIIRLEIERFVNLSLATSLNLPPPRDELTEEYFQRLVYHHSNNICRLRGAFSLILKE